MGIQERKQKEKRMRKEAILEAARKVFLEKGFKGATMEDIAGTSNFTKKTLYAYFNSKDELYYDIIREGFDILNSLINESLEDKVMVNEVDKIKILGGTLIYFSIQYPDYFEVIMEYENKLEDMKENNPVLKELYEAGQYSFDFLHKFVRDGIEKGEITSKMDAVSTTLVLWSCLIGAIRLMTKKVNYIKSYYDINEIKVIEDTFELLVSAIKKG